MAFSEGHPSRRAVLAGGAAGLALGLAPRGLRALEAAEVIEARAAQVRLLPGGAPATQVWSYGGSVPAPEIRLPQGARLTRRLVNRLPVETSIHWHGLRLPNAMDGVPGLTQEPVAPGGDFLYDFALRDAGTFWFHSHARSFEQVERGLHGALVVEEAEAPGVDRDMVLVIDDWRLDPESLQISEDFGNLHDLSHGGRLGNIATTNGAADFALEVSRGERLRLRLLNAATARLFELGLKGLEGWIMALDGQPLEAPEPVGETFILAPGQRADLIVDVTAEAGEEAFLIHHLRGTGYAQARFPVRTGTAARRPAPTLLPPNPMPAPQPAAARPARLVMEGGAMRGMAGAMFEGRRMGMRELASRGMFWALNGVAGLGEAPLLSAASGETVRITMENRTAFPHGMHLHGHHMREILPGGRLGPWRDTVLLWPDETREYVFTAEGPGKWAFHCHMLGHAEAGMMGWAEVTA
ncbi:Multicopper oxidase with three cupredoxin domains (includes cell division protein FtsP and spore coat protein CotA) [Meinhardsimonia xiamenensis]|jgi:FtsP/CotA-like multicopper oxidase with cupredoxin domain|uniref:Multicopper oxidase with three cupredoxin domains (Includes cell division protein FtsP and spore coat protein CotA) n=1 Tax=Meinhardsimonia xiamenensis TaxID=990712 RepID=A0A1G9BB98_9RHOB|nr:multicopper oxidase family protein [Meinhardsimonia xiamenensis]PRX35045.1 FtsP/CotA-like multicopper oxidase with cupredoxin domain [Meinhardsimonia xiamenensis]SDK36743.1 Multicopper oxidase with three cupredoxin domains (includes cell division protein FtsP and spore coat protein CotA) [Meinhardsimonia xiamenensis]